MQLQQKPSYCHEEQQKSIQLVLLKTNMHSLQIKDSLPLNQNQEEGQQAIKLQVYQYSIKIEPPIGDDNKVFLAQLLKGATENLKQVLGRYYIQGRTIYTLTKTKEIQSLITQQVFGYIFNLSINLKKKINIYQNNLSHILLKNNNQITLQCLNAIFQHISKEYQSQSSHSLSIRNKENIQKKSIRNIFKAVNFQSCFGSQIYLTMDAILNIDLRDNAYIILKQHSNQIDQENALIGQYIQTKYNNKMVYQVHKIDYKKNPQSKFYSSKLGRRLSYEEYYKEKYQIIIKDLKQPLFIYQRKFRDKLTNEQKVENIHFIPELCVIDNKQRKQQSFDNNSFQPINDNSLSDQLYQRQVQSMSIIQNLSSEIGVDIEQKNNTINGYYLQPPKLILQNKQEVILNKGNKLFSINSPITNTITFKEWIFVYPYQEKTKAQRLILFIKAIGQKLGIQVQEPFHYEMYENDLSDGILLLKKDFKIYPLPQFIVSYVPSNHPFQKRFYLDIKEFLCVQVGIEHQHITQTFFNQNEKLSIAQSIVLQIVSKLGNQLWETSLPSEISQNTMVIAIAVGQKTFSNIGKNGILGNQNMVGVITTINNEMNLMDSEIFFKDEMDVTLHMILNKIVFNSISQYVKRLLKLPDTLIIYRQGLSSSQIPLSIYHEVEAIKNGFRLFDDKYAPRFAYITVCKSVNQRFYQDKLDTEIYQNRNYSPVKSANSGSIVPLINNCQGQFEFFLCSQDLTSGISMPTKYICLHNNTLLSQQTFWQFTYNQCFNYVNSQGPIRIPAPLQYATKLLKFRQNILNQQPSYALKQSLYYI